MSLHKLSAGDGYQYLIRQTAAADQDLTGRQSLADYYSEKGERPGHWFGRGLAHLAGVQTGEQVDGEQMRALFGEGRHPNAEALERAAVRQSIAAGMAPSVAARQAAAAGALGRRFAAPQREGALAIACARAYEAHNVERGMPRNAAIPEQVRTEIRTAVARQLFEERHGRPPAPGGRELSGFMAKESRPAEQACAGYDLTFSPVKSVSTLWAIADRDTARTIEDAHQAAVEDTIEWLEREVIYTRRGAGGARTVDVDGVIAAAFLHRDARSGDPDLHTHVAIANKVRDPSDGAWLAIDGQVLYKHTVAASERYNARLEAELTQRLGVAWTDAEDPRRGAKRTVREIAGVPRDLMQRWSQRRTAIDAQLALLTSDFREKHGRVPSAKEMLALAQEANLATREAKHEHRSEAEQRAQWRREAAAVLGTEEVVDTVVPAVRDQRPPLPAGAGAAPAEEALREVAAVVLTRVTEDRATFQRAHVIAEAARQVRGLHVPPAALDATVRRVVDLALSGDALVASTEAHEAPAVVQMEEAGPVAAVALAGAPVDEASVPAGFARADGTSQYVTPGAALYTTDHVLRAEQSLVAAATESTDMRLPSAAVGVALMEEIANGGVELNAGQRALVEDFVTGGERVRLALAPAGTGKTTAMRAAASAWRQHGGKVLALAPSAAAAAVLGESVGARADTLAKLRYEILNGASSDGPLREVQPGTMIVVDEAGMACARDLATVVEAAQRRGAVVRLIGDDQQLAAIGAGGVLRDIEAAAGANRSLTEVVRFRVPGEAEASLAMREGRAEEALGWLLDHDRVRTTSAATATEDVFAAWCADVDQGLDALMIAATNEDVTALNRLARLHRLSGPANAAERQRYGEAGPPAAGLASGLEASAGDTIVTRRNERRLPITTTDFVKNGDRWTVQRVLRDGGLRARHHGTGRTITLPADYVDRDVDLGYATTVYGAQGQTVDTTHALIDGREDRQTTYVALTRGRACNTAHVVASGDGDEHNVLRPENQQQRSAAETLHAVLSRDGSATSATSTRADDLDPARRLADAVAVHVDAIAHATELQLGADALAAITETADQAYTLAQLTPSTSAAAPVDDGHQAALDLEVETSGVSPTAAADPTLLDPHAAPLSESKTWPRLLSWLAVRELEDGPGSAGRRLAAAVEGHPIPVEIDGRPVTDPAAVLLSRLQRTVPAGGPLPWLPPVPEALQDRLDASDPSTGAWLAERATDVAERAAVIAADASTWTATNAPSWAQPYLTGNPADRAVEGRDDEQARQLVADLAVWRAAHGVPDEDLRPAGPRPSDRAERTHYTRLVTRATRLQPRTGGRSAEAWARRLAAIQATGALAGFVNPASTAAADSTTASATAIAVDALVADPWWPVLAARLEDLVGSADTWASTGLREAAADLQDRVAEAVAAVAAADESSTQAATSGGDSTESLGDHDAAGQDVEREHAAVGASWVPQRPDARIVAAHRAAQAFYRTHLEGSWVPGYLADRGMSHLVDAGKVGYAPGGRTALVDHLASEGFTTDELLAAGLAVERSTGTVVDRFRDRLMFTIEDRAIDPAPSGAGDAGTPGPVPVAFIGRCAPTAGPRVPKYLNTSATAAYTKGNVLYGLAEHAEAIADGATPVLVEGPVDAEAVTRAGTAAASNGAPAFVGIATCGTALTAEHVAALADVVDLEHRTILVATDDDAAGKKAAARAWRLLHDAGCAETRSVDLGAYNDPAELLQDDGPAALAAALEASSSATGLDAAMRSLHAQVIDSRLQEWAPVLDHIDGRLGALRALAADVAAGTPDQQAYATAQLVVRIDLDVETIHRELGGEPEELPAELEAADAVDPDTAEEPAATDPEAPAGDVDREPAGEQLVDQLLVDALQRPLPDEYAAAALWTRLDVAATGRRRTAADVDQLLVDHLGPERASALADAPAWPALRDLGRDDLDALRDALKTHDAREVDASTLLSAIAPPRPSIQRTGLPSPANAPRIKAPTDEVVRRPETETGLDQRRDVRRGPQRGPRQ